MDIATLAKANAIKRKMDELSSALQCFEWTDGTRTLSTNPRLIIEFDGDGREQIKLPMDLSNEFVNFMKSTIKEEHRKLSGELQSM